MMTLKIDGELRHASDHYPYIEKLAKGELSPSPVGVGTACGSTVTVESLRAIPMSTKSQK